MRQYTRFSEQVDRYLGTPEVLTVVLLTAVIVGLIYYVGQLIAPIFVAAVIAYVMHGLVNLLTGVGVPFRYAKWSVSALASLTVILMVLLLPSLWTQLLRILQTIPQLWDSTLEWMRDATLQYPQLLGAVNLDQVNDSVREIAFDSLGSLVGSGLDTLIGLGQFLMYTVLVPVMVFFFVKDGSDYIRWFVEKLLPKRSGLIVEVWGDFSGRLSSYVRGKFLEATIVAVISWILFAVVGVPYAELLGILVGFSVFVPVIGAAIVTVPVAAVGVQEFGVSSGLIVLLAGYAVVQAIDAGVLVPYIFSDAVSLAPVSIIIAVIVFGGLWGFWGVFLSIPLATLLKAFVVVLPKYTSSEWRNPVLSSGESVEPSERPSAQRADSSSKASSTSEA